MTDPLLDPTDYASFKAKDESWFLGAVGETIRDHCGWHIWPIVSDTNVESKIGNKGIILLPTLNLVSVDALRVRQHGVDTELDSSCYTVHKAGYVTMRTYGWRRALGTTVSVDITHGFETLPKTIAEVGFELTGSTVEKPSAAVTDITRGPTRIKFRDELGASLSEAQENRLAPYTLTGG